MNQLNTPVTISAAFYGKNTDNFLHHLFGKRLLPNEQDPKNFFTRHGLVTKSRSDQMVQTPVQLVTDFENERGDDLRVATIGMFRSTPDVGADTPAPTNPQAIPQSTFKFKIVDCYSKSLAIPTQQQEYRVSISTYATYMSQLQAYWQGSIENTLLIYGAGIRGVGDNWGQINVTQSGTGVDMAKGDVSTFNNYMAKMNEYNPITAPRRNMASWHSDTATLDTPLGPSGALAAGEQTFTLSFINKVATILGLLSTDRVGIKWEKPDVRYGENMENKIQRCPWIISPEIAELIRNQISKEDASMGGAGPQWGDVALASIAGGKTSSGGFFDGQIGHIYGFSFIEWDRLPRYFGGAAGDVPVVRTLILGKQSLCYGFRTRQIPSRFQDRMHSMMKMVGPYGGSFQTWIEGINHGRKSSLESTLTFGVSKIHFPVPEDPTRIIDKGVVAVDIPYKNRVGSGKYL